jgi:hypothetical protein
MYFETTNKTKAQPKGTNQYTGYANDGRSINKGRGPTKAGSTGDTVPNATAKSGMINGGATVKAAKGNYGRGPTKGCEC